MNDLYTIENAQKFNWSSISGDLNPERVQHLEKYLVGETILDAGCGGGAYVEFLVQKGLTVTGIDQHAEFLNYANDRDRQGLYLQGDVTKLPFPDKSFDCTYCFDVLEHVDDVAAIQELARVTKKRLIITVPKEDDVMTDFNLTFLHYQDKTHLRNYTDTSLRSLVALVRHVKLDIFPELDVPLQLLLQKFICLGSIQVLAPYITLLAIKAAIKKVFQLKRFKFSELQASAQEFLLGEIIRHSSKRTIPTGIVAVIDLSH